MRAQYPSRGKEKVVCARGGGGQRIKYDINKVRKITAEIELCYN